MSLICGSLSLAVQGTDCEKSGQQEQVQVGHFSPTHRSRLSSYGDLLNYALASQYSRGAFLTGSSFGGRCHQLISSILSHRDLLFLRRCSATLNRFAASLSKRRKRLKTSSEPAVALRCDRWLFSLWENFLRRIG